MFSFSSNSKKIGDLIDFPASGLNLTNYILGES